MSDIVFKEDLEKIEDSVQWYPMGSYQIGEIARLSSLLYDRSVDVVEILERECLENGIKIEDIINIK